MLFISVIMAINSTDFVFCAQVRLDGAAKRSRHLSKSVAYVPQHDTHLLPYLTVYETCMYSAELQLPWFTSTADKRAKALAVLEELNLLGVANSRVGAADGGGKAPGSRRSSLAKAFGGSSAVGGICRGTCVSTDDGPSVRTGQFFYFYFLAIRLT